jgi:hypothetical protein
MNPVVDLSVKQVVIQGTVIVYTFGGGPCGGTSEPLPTTGQVYPLGRYATSHS